MSHRCETGSRSDAAGNPACSICGTLNARDAEFCRYCGVSITPASQHIALLEHSGFCETCQCAHATPARFCDQCGGKLPGYVRPPDLSSQSAREVASTGPADVAATSPVTRNAKTGETSRPLATAEDRRRSTAHYLIMPVVFAATVVGMYVSGYRITQIDAGSAVPSQATASVPAAVLHPVAAPSHAGRNDAMNASDTIVNAPIEPADAEPPIGNRAQADLPVLQAPPAAEPSGRPLRPTLQPVIVEAAYEEPVSAIRELPAMPVYEFKSVVQLDAARN